MLCNVVSAVYLSPQIEQISGSSFVTKNMEKVKAKGEDVDQEYMAEVIKKCAGAAFIG